MRSRVLATFIAAAAWLAFATVFADARTRKTIEDKKPTEGIDIVAGRALALDACSGCHVVASNQPYMPIYKGTIRPPNFKDIANKPNASAPSLRMYLSSLPAIPKASQMANPDLTEEQLRDVTAFIMTLRDASLQSLSSSR